MGFLAAMRLRFEEWRPLLDLNRVEYGFLLPILLYCVDPSAQPMLNDTHTSRSTLRNHHLTITRPPPPVAPSYGVALFAPVPAPAAPPPGVVPLTPVVPLFWLPFIGAPPPIPP